MMILTWGMSEKLGPVYYGPETVVGDTVYLMPGEKDYSDNTAQQIDGEIREVLHQAFIDAKKVIEENKDKVEKIAKALLKYETLDAAEVKTMLEGGSLNKPTVGDLLKVEQDKINPPKAV